MHPVPQGPKLKSNMIGALILALRCHPHITLVLRDIFDSNSALRLRIGCKRNALRVLTDPLKAPGQQNHSASRDGAQARELLRRPQGQP